MKLSFTEKRFPTSVTTAVVLGCNKSPIHAVGWWNWYYTTMMELMRLRLFTTVSGILFCFYFPSSLFLSLLLHYVGLFFAFICRLRRFVHQVLLGAVTCTNSSASKVHLFVLPPLIHSYFTLLQGISYMFQSGMNRTSSIIIIPQHAVYLLHSVFWTLYYPISRLAFCIVIIFVFCFFYCSIV